MLNLINLLTNVGDSPEQLCGDLEPVLKIVGIVVWGIKVVVPIILIVVGMLDLAKAIGEKNEDEIKKAQNKLIKRAIAAVLVFLVVTFVSLIMGLIGGTDYKACMDCVNHPFACSIDIEDINSAD